MSAGHGSDERPGFRVHVSGLAKTAVHRHDGNQCYDEEYAVGDFFHNHGCDVTWVSLLVDKKSSRSRGFAFVDFEDEASFKQACALNGTENPAEVKLDPKSGGRIQVSPAKPSEDDTRKEQLELTQERDRTDGMEKDLRLCAARINEKMEQIQAQRARQLSLQNAGNVEEEVNNQRSRQKQIKSLMAELDAMETSLAKELRAEKERTQALEELQASTHTDHWEAAPDSDRSGEQPDRPVKPQIVPAAEDLHRSISTFSQSADSGAGAPPAPAASIQRAPSVSGVWLAKREEKEEALKRAASVASITSVHGDISRSLLDGKIEALERTASEKPDRVDKAASAVSKRKPAGPRWEDLTDDSDQDGESLAATSIWGRGMGRRDVLVKNLPALPDEEVKSGLVEELARLWETTGRQPPKVEKMRIVAGEVAGTAAKLPGKEAGKEALIVFVDPYDAWLLVEHCGTQDWSSSLTPTFHGRVLKLEWPSRPKPPPPDFRKMTFRADTDASSEFSYNTIGTINSRSSIIARTSATRESPHGKGGKGIGGVGGVGGGVSGEYVPPQNRTVILSGIPINLKEYDVKNEILGLLQRLYQRKGYTFEPKVHLHKGIEGLEVRPPFSRQDENGGTVKLRLRNYADAIWLVEQAGGLKVAGSKVKAFWAQPRHGKGAGKDDSRGYPKGDSKGGTKASGKGGRP